MNFQPLGDRILIKRTEKNNISKGGIIIPKTTEQKSSQGTVISIGEKVKNGVKEGDKILFNKWGETEIKVNNEEHLIIKEIDILGVFKK